MSVCLNRVRKNFYMDSVALMRHSRAISELASIEQAALMIGSVSNKGILQEAGLLLPETQSAGANDLIIAVKTTNAETGEAALRDAETLLDKVNVTSTGTSEYQPRSLDTAIRELPDANIALISVPGEFAAAEAHKALRKGLHVMLFSDNVSLEAESELKREAQRRGLLVMGPDCGTAMINGAPLAFANVVAKGNIGLVAASGTGLQEVATLIDRYGKGITHGIGVGGRDLKEAIGGTMTLSAIDALDRDPQTGHIVLISKPPAGKVADAVVARIGQSGKRFTVCFLGLDALSLPANATFAPTLTEAAERVLGKTIRNVDGSASAASLAHRLGSKRNRLQGLYSGGTLCAEAQVILRREGLEVGSNAAIPGAKRISTIGEIQNGILDLGADEYTLGRPHPMIDPGTRNELLTRALTDDATAVVLLDVVIGYGAHDNPAGSVAEILAKSLGNGPVVIAAVTGTEADPQVYSNQVRTLKDAGVNVAPSNARAVELAAAILNTSGGANGQRRNCAN